MKHSFHSKKNYLKDVLKAKLDITNVAINSKEDVAEVINTINSYIELEDTLQLASCSYNFISSHITFQLELMPDKSKEDFFEAVKKIDEFLNLES